MRLAILSDTHGLLRPEVRQILTTVDAIVHAGDFHTPAIVAELEQYAPLYGVRGNNDHDWALSLPYHRTICLEGTHFLVVHNKKDVPTDLTGIQVVVYGHSHQYVQKEIDGILWINPGSCGPRRFRQEITMAVLEIHQGNIQITKLVFPHEVK